MSEQLWLYSHSASWCTSNLALLSTPKGHGSVLAHPNHTGVCGWKNREKECVPRTHSVIYETQASNKGCSNDKTSKTVRNFEMINYAFIPTRYILSYIRFPYDVLFLRRIIKIIIKNNKHM